LKAKFWIEILPVRFHDFRLARPLPSEGWHLRSHIRDEVHFVETLCQLHGNSNRQIPDLQEPLLVAKIRSRKGPVGDFFGWFRF
jgi:hypothetical protein